MVKLKVIVYKAEILNDQFKSVLMLDNENDTSSMELTKHHTMDILTIHTKIIEKLLQKHKLSKASSPDNLPAYIRRETASELAPELTVIFNQSLKRNIFPIFKKEPVSLTCICSKVMEHILCKHIQDK